MLWGKIVRWLQQGSYLCSYFMLTIYNIQLMSGKAGNKREKYRKIPLKMKVQMIKKIIEDGQSIKKVANQFNINYSTVKTIYRNEKLKKNKYVLAQMIQNTHTEEKITPTSNETQPIQCGFLYIPPSFEMMGNREEPQREGRRATRIQVISKITFPEAN